MSDGGYSLSCKGPLSDCLHHAERLCRDEGYTVREARSVRERLGGETGQSQVIIEKSDATIYCGNSAPHPELRLQRETELPADPAGTPPKPTTPSPAVAAAPLAPAATHVCVPGATQACVGPGGCSGGQACSADGARFGDCNCGSPQPTPPAAP